MEVWNLLLIAYMTAVSICPRTTYAEIMTPEEAKQFITDGDNLEQVIADIAAEPTTFIDYVTQDDRTLLMYAAEYARTSVVQQLVGSGADVDSQDMNGYTPLMVAADSYKDNFATIVFLLKSGSDVNLLSDKNGTVIHILTSKEKSDSLELTMKFCPNISLENSKGNTALEIAEEEEYTAIIEILTDTYYKTCTFNMVVYYEDETRIYENKIYSCNDACTWTYVGDHQIESPATTAAPTPCDNICPTVYDPVCGSDGNTYSNDCSLQIAVCNNPSITEVPCASTTAAPTPCDNICPTVYDPVCGSDGNTYSNNCSLQIAVCNNPSITEVPCDTNGKTIKIVYLRINIH